MSKGTKFFLVLAVVFMFCASSMAYARPSLNPKGWFKKGGTKESVPPPSMPSQKDLKAHEKAAKKKAKEAKKQAKKQSKIIKAQTKKAANEVKPTM